MIGITGNAINLLDMVEIPPNFSSTDPIIIFENIVVMDEKVYTREYS